MVPFDQDDDVIEWVTIKKPELDVIKELSAEWCNQSFISSNYRHFGYLILGRDKDIETYYIGIPDIYDPKQKYILALDKIEKFKFRNERDKKIGDLGYWIVRVQ